MNPKCPACRVLARKSPGGGSLCNDCENTEGVRKNYDEFWILNNLRQCVFLFTYFYPVLIQIHVLLIWVLGFSWMIVFGYVCCWGVWFFNVFWLYPRLKVPKRGEWHKVEEARDKLFLAKVAARKIGWDREV